MRGAPRTTGMNQAKFPTPKLQRNFKSKSQKPNPEGRDPHQRRRTPYSSKMGLGLMMVALCSRASAARRRSKGSRW